jgi:hypothetical protein
LKVALNTINQTKPKINYRLSDMVPYSMSLDVSVLPKSF